SRSSFYSTYSTSLSGGHRHAARIGDPRRGVPSVARNEAAAGRRRSSLQLQTGRFRETEFCLGEPVGIRTRDLLIKSQLLYRLSYGLFGRANIGRAPHRVNRSARSGKPTPLQILLAITQQTPALAKSYKFLPRRDSRYIMGLHRSLISWVKRRTPTRGAKRGMRNTMNDFARLLEVEIPRLRRYARALTRDVSRADDLVQSCLTRAIAKQHLWQPGTDLRAWLFTILHNQHVNDVRRSVREGVNVAVEEMAPVLTVQSNAIAALQLRDLERAIGQLPQEQRQVILLVGLEGMRYEEVAAILGVPVGTVRSRLSRGRDQLRRLMDMADEMPARQQLEDSEDTAPRRRPATQRYAA